MDKLCNDLQAIILDKVQKNNEMTLAFYQQDERDDTKAHCLLYVKRNMLDHPNHLTLYIYQNGNHDDKYELMTIMVRNEETLKAFIYQALLQRFSYEVDDYFVTIRTSYIQGDFSVPKEMLMPYAKGSFRKGAWGLSNSDEIDHNQPLFVERLTDFITKKIKALISVA